MNASLQKLENGTRVRMASHTGIITNNSGEETPHWYNIKWDDGWKHCCNYYSRSEFEVIDNEV